MGRARSTCSQPEGSAEAILLLGHGEGSPWATPQRKGAKGQRSRSPSGPPSSKPQSSSLLIPFSSACTLLVPGRILPISYKPCPAKRCVRGTVPCHQPCPQVTAPRHAQHPWLPKKLGLGVCSMQGRAGLFAVCFPAPADTQVMVPPQPGWCRASLPCPRPPCPRSHHVPSVHHPSQSCLLSSQPSPDAIPLHSPALPAALEAKPRLLTHRFN